MGELQAPSGSCQRKEQGIEQHLITQIERTKANRLVRVGKVSASVPDTNHRQIGGRWPS